jgi:hypothetical protein
MAEWLKAAVCKISPVRCPDIPSPTYNASPHISGLHSVTSGGCTQKKNTITEFATFSPADIEKDWFDFFGAAFRNCAIM